jgi:hypothetical protein
MTERPGCEPERRQAKASKVLNELPSILVVVLASVQRLLLVALCRILDAVTGFLDLLSGLVYRVVDCLAGMLGRAFLLAAG